MRDMPVAYTTTSWTASIIGREFTLSQFLGHESLVKTVSWFPALGNAAYPTWLPCRLRSHSINPYSSILHLAVTDQTRCAVTTAMEGPSLSRPLTSSPVPGGMSTTSTSTPDQSTSPIRCRKIGRKSGQHGPVTQRSGC